MTFKSILVADDMLEVSEHALQEAVDIARLTRAKLTLVSVIPIVSPSYPLPVPVGDSIASLLDTMKKRLEAQRVRLLTAGISEVDTILLEGDPVDRVVEYAQQHHPDLIVVGSRGLSAAGRFLLGSVSDGILHHVHCSVLVVKPPAVPSHA
ncbi:MAG TPA: universal stress protein [Thermoplasmata archaeon]|nr:universal stress protein [Thermoplasmata archaeon]